MATKVGVRSEFAYERASALHRLGRLAEARVLCLQALKLRPRYFDALQLLGTLDLQANRLEGAVEAFGKAILINSRSAAAHYHQGNANCLLMRFEAAVASYTRAIALDPDFVAALYNRGIALHAVNDYSAAIETYDRAIAIDTNHVDAYFNRGNALLALRRFDEAIDSYGRAIAIKPDHAEARNNRGNAAYGLERYEAALAEYDQALALRPDYADAYNNRGNALRDLGQYEAAVASCDQAIALKPEYPEALNNRASALFDLERYAAALADCDRAIALKPDYAEPHFNRGNALLKLALHDAAIASYDRAIGCKPNHVQAHYNCGNALFELQCFEAAITRYDRALVLKPALAKAHYNRGAALFELKLYAAAVQSCDAAIALDPCYADACYIRGNALFELGHYAAALAGYDAALTLKPDYTGLYGVRRQAKMRICDWSDFDTDVADLAVRIERGEAATPPHHWLGLSDSARLQRRAAETWVREQCPPDPSLPAFPTVAAIPAASPRKIRIGYFSADFRHHPVSILIAELIETHDRTRFEITAFAFGPPSEDAMRRRLERAFDQFIDVRGRSDRQIALLAREMHIDIAVDLGGFTHHCRPGIFALRAAPLQVGFLGYPGTLGAPYLDYLLADPTLIPEPSRVHYREQILYLPHSVLPHDSKQPIAEPGPTRRQAGLPDAGFVFCCFNQVAKITPHTFAGWMRILTAVPGSVLWLSATHPTAQSHLWREAAQRGIEPKRLIFAERLAALPEHLARQRLADLFLDTLPYNAHSTASDALWAGLPLLTQLGESFAGRVAGSLLTAIGLTDLITSTPEQYEALAIALATDPARLASFRERLARNRLTAPLFDTRRYTRDLEAAFETIHTRYQAGSPPEH